MFVRKKILAYDLREAILSMNGLVGVSAVKLLLQRLEHYGVLPSSLLFYDSNFNNNYSRACCSFDEISDALGTIFGANTPLFMSLIENHLKSKID